MVRHIPIDVILSWPTPNYVDPVRRGAAAVNVTIAFITLVSIAVFLRLYVHMFLIRWFGAGDVFIILAYLSTIAMTALEIVGYERYDWGRHIWDVPINNFSRSIYISWWYRIVYSAAACFTRMALIFFYYRITNASNSTKVFRRWIHAVAVFSAATGLALVLATIFQCNPIRAMWTWPPVQGARCINEGQWTFVCGIINTIADIAVVVLPMPIIYRLRLPLRKRISAILLVSLGFLVCLVGGVRAYYVWLSLIHSYDVTWNGYGALVAATVEIHVGLLCACAPAIRLGYIKLLRPQLESIRSTFPTKNSQSTKISTKMSSVKASVKPQKIKRPWTANSGTFLASATRNSSDEESHYAYASKSIMHELRTVDDSSDDGFFITAHARPKVPEKDEIYLTREVRVEVNPPYEGDAKENNMRRWTSSDTAVEYADAMVFARRSDIASSAEPTAEDFYYTSVQPTTTHGLTTNNRIETRRFPALQEETASEATTDFGQMTERSRDSPPSPTRLKRSGTLQIPEKTLKATREQTRRPR